MSDDTNGQGTPPSWTPPPPGNPTPPPPPQQDFQAHQGAPSGDPTGSTPQPATKSRPNVNLSPEIVLGVVAVLGVVLGLVLKVEPKFGASATTADGKVKLWDAMGWPWSILAIVAAVATLVPAFRGAINVSEKLASTITMVAAAALVFWWVLFVLPVISLTTGFLATVGVAAGVGAVWLTRDTSPAES
jgi:hypothetical protein